MRCCVVPVERLHRARLVIFLGLDVSLKTRLRLALWMAYLRTGSAQNSFGQLEFLGGFECEADSATMYQGFLEVQLLDELKQPVEAAAKQDFFFHVALERLLRTF